jgi:uncharacterized small protein (DUF1192 family)
MDGKEIAVIKNSKQNWTVGQTVKVGFLSLVVRAAIATPGDGLPDAYFLSNIAGTKLYEFIPHQGLTLITVEEAQAKVAYFRKSIERIAANETAKAIQRAQASAKFNEIFAEVA